VPHHASKPNTPIHALAEFHLGAPELLLLLLLLLLLDRGLVPRLSCE
jgi:hypothetical protein